MKRVFFSCLIGVALMLLPSAFVAAHPLDVAYFDFSRTATATVLTVAIHPYQAYELVRGANLKPFDLAALRAKGDLVSAYVQNHVEITSCTWEAGDAFVPSIELDAVADGVTIFGPLDCEPVNPKQLTLRTDLFLERFPNQTDIVRLEYPDGFAEKATIDRSRRVTTIDLRDLFVSSVQTSSVATSTLYPLPMSPRGRTPDAGLVDLAKRSLEPGLGFWSFAVVLMAVAAIGALHALGPGHGKSLMAATMVGSHATYGRVILLGTVMTVTHVADVFLMALLAGVISAVVPQTTLFHYLEIVSAGGLVFMGCVSLFRAVTRYRFIQQNPEAGNLEEAHHRAHELGLPHSHDHAHEPHGHRHEQKDRNTSFRQALWLGFFGALAPCPSAWAVFLATLATGHIWSGVLLLIAFTIGLHITILIIGILIVASSSFALRKTPPRITYILPVVSATIIIVIGSVLLAQSW